MKSVYDRGVIVIICTNASKIFLRVFDERRNFDAQLLSDTICVVSTSNFIFDEYSDNRVCDERKIYIVERSNNVHFAFRAA